MRFDLALHCRQVIRPPAVLKVRLFDIDLQLDSGSFRVGNFELHTTPLEPDSGCLSRNIDSLGSLEFLEHLGLLECLDYLEYVELLQVIPKIEGTQASQGIHRVSIDLRVVWLHRPCQTICLGPTFG